MMNFKLRHRHPGEGRDPGRKLDFKKHGTAWIPAFAGMTILMAVSLSYSVDTTIKGGSMELLDKGEKVIFKGGVKLTRGTDILKATKMTTNKKRDKVTAEGNVELNRQLDNEEWLGYGKEGFYNTENGQGYLLGGQAPAKMVYIQVLSSTMTRRMDIIAKKFDFFKEEQKAIGLGEVYGKTIDPETGEVYEFWSDKAVYEGDKRKMTLSGVTQPQVRQSLGDEKKLIWGDVITYYVDEERFFSDGNSKAVFHENSATDKTKRGRN